MRETEQSFERSPETRPELGPRGDGGDAVWIRSEDGRAELVMARGEDDNYDLRSFRTERTADGLDSAWRTMDDAERAGAVRPPELSATFGPSADYVDLLRDEPASVAFWRERATASMDAVGGDVAGDLPRRDVAERDEAFDIARRMVEDSERRPEVAAFEDPARWIADINSPGTTEPGRDYNCVFCGLATEQRWRGAAVQAGEWPHETGLSFETAQDLVGRLESSIPADIDRTLRDAGAGSSGLVALETVAGTGHMVNVVNDRGMIRWLDGQQATVDAAPPSYATGYRWTARDPEGRPL